MRNKIVGQRWKKQRRKEYRIKIEHRYYIFCEGEQTEPQYFNGFKNRIEENPIYNSVIEIKPCAMETMRVIGKAEEYIQKNHIEKGQVWCVYDKDSFPASDFNNVVNRARKLNESSFGSS